MIHYDAIQPDAPADVLDSGSGKRVRRGTKGDRKAQAKRYWLRNSYRLRCYKRAWYAARKLASKQEFTDDL